MQFLLLLYGEEALEPAPGTPEFDAMIQGYEDFSVKMNEGDKIVSANALMPTETAKTVTLRDGKTTAIDGPFAETKEQLGGYFLLECKDLDEAIACAAMIPAAKDGRVEIRPVMVFD